MRKPIAIITISLVVIALVLVSINHSSTKPHVLSAYSGSYVALGDSVAAGVGLETYSDSSACDRTNQSYPDLVASKLNMKLHNLACSGATLPEGILGPQDVNQLMVTPQLNQLFSLAKPSLISLTIGANDAQWTTFIQQCYSSQCDTASNSLAVSNLLSTVSGNLQAVLSQIQAHYKAQLPKVVVTGYHQVFPATVLNCSDLVHINQADDDWVRQQQTDLNMTIMNVVSKFSFAKFASINFNGHELCTSNSWVQGLLDNEPFHPTDQGQAEYAQQVISTFKSFK